MKKPFPFLIALWALAAPHLAHAVLPECGPDSVICRIVSTGKEALSPAACKWARQGFEELYRDELSLRAVAVEVARENRDAQIVARAANDVMNAFSLRERAALEDACHKRRGVFDLFEAVLSRLAESRSVFPEGAFVCPQWDALCRVTEAEQKPLPMISVFHTSYPCDREFRAFRIKKGDALLVVKPFDEGGWWAHPIYRASDVVSLKSGGRPFTSFSINPVMSLDEVRSELIKDRMSLMGCDAFYRDLTEP